MPSTAITFGYCTPSVWRCQHRVNAGFSWLCGFTPLRREWYHICNPLAIIAKMEHTWGRVGSTGAFSDGLQAEVAAALAKNSGEQVTGEREFALAA